MRRWATNPDQWEVVPPSVSSHTGFGPNLTIGQVVEIVKAPPPVMSGLRLNDGGTTR